MPIAEGPGIEITRILQVTLRKNVLRWDRFCKFGVVAAKQAVAHAGLEINEANADKIGTIIGSGVGGLLTMETQAHVLEGKGPGRVSPFTVPMMIPNMATGLAAIGGLLFEVKILKK